MRSKPGKQKPAFKTRERDSGGNAEKCSRELEQGVRLLQQGDLVTAKNCFDRAASFNPREPVVHNCLGIVARLQQRLAESVVHFEQAIRLRPDLAEAHSNLGNALRDLGQLDRAQQSYQRAITLKPEFAEAYNNLGVIHLSLGETDQAIRCFEAAIQRQPGYVEAHNNLANTFRQRGELIDALASFTTALELRPGVPEIHNNLANVLRDLGHIQQAQEHYETAIRLKPDFAEAHGNLGNVLVDLDQVDQAIAAYLRASGEKSLAVSNFTNLGNAYRLAGQTGQARAAYVRAAALEPQRLTHQLRIAALCSQVFLSSNEIQQNRERAFRQWQGLAEVSRQRGGWHLTDDVTEPSFNWQFLDGNIRPIKEAYARIFADSFSHPVPLHAKGIPRIGVVVTKGHEGLFLRSMRGIVERLDASRFQIVIICPGVSEPKLRQGIARDVEFLVISQGIQQAAEAIHAARFDLLYYWEVGTDALNYFLPFLRLAPVQCTSWGIQVTSGIDNVDYYLSSELVEPAEAQQHYTETLLLAPTLLTYQFRPQLSGPPLSRASFGFSDAQHLYICAQQPGKFHPDFDELLAGILRADPRGIVVGAGDRYGHASRRLAERFSRTIHDIADRIVFLSRLDYSNYLNLLAVADVLLDPPHFGGVNSTYDGLALAQPIVTMPSTFHRGRYTAGCYRKMGLDDCVARDRDDYVRLAVKLAVESDFRNDVRRRIRESNDLLFHDVQAVTEHQRIFEELVEIAREKQTGR